MSMATPLKIRQCSNCGAEVKIFHKERLARENVFCCKKCEGEFVRKKTILNVECPICHKKFHLKPSQKIKYTNHYCSKECLKKGQSINMQGENNHQYGLKGELNASWKSDEKISTYGYKLIRVLDHPFRNEDDMVFEHRLIAEKFLLTPENSIEINGKRYLKQEYVVHHKDGNRLNNDVDNLQVMTLSEHTKLHHKQNKVVKNKNKGENDDYD